MARSFDYCSHYLCVYEVQFHVAACITQADWVSWYNVSEKYICWLLTITKPFFEQIVYRSRNILSSSPSQWLVSAGKIWISRILQTPREDKCHAMEYHAILIAYCTYVTELNSSERHILWTCRYLEKGKWVHISVYLLPTWSWQQFILNDALIEFILVPLNWPRVSNLEWIDNQFVLTIVDFWFHKYYTCLISGQNFIPQYLQALNSNYWAHEVLSRERAPSRLTTNNGSHFIIQTETDWPNSLRCHKWICQNPRPWALKFPLYLASAGILLDFESSAVTFLIRYHNFVHTSTGNKPLRLFESLPLRLNLLQLESTEDMHNRGNAFLLSKVSGSK